MSYRSVHTNSRQDKRNLQEMPLNSPKDISTWWNDLDLEWREIIGIHVNLLRLGKQDALQAATTDAVLVGKIRSPISQYKKITKTRRKHILTDTPPSRVELKAITHLYLAGSRIKTFEPIKAIPNVEALNCSGCRNLKSLNGVHHLKILCILLCRNCPQLASLEPLGQLPRLRSLSCDDCPSLTSLLPLSGSRSLRSLYCSGCSGLTTIESLNCARNLEIIDCGACPGLTAIQLHDLLHLRELDCSFCMNLETLTLRHLPKFKTMYGESCAGLKTVNLKSGPELAVVFNV